ncbi:MAG: CBS domain-containing protein [Alphaproteobacteria bacterium]|jgi:CBS domain-containing protein|nr:CBS domain-containing protein [Alphaproteobacteria bacterium]
MTVERLLRIKGREVVTIRPDAPLADVAHKLSEGKFGALIVSEDGRTIQGIISERDLVRTIAEQGASALDQKVADVMTREVVTCSVKDKSDHVMAVMSHRRFRHLPVVENGVLCGVISMTDLMRHRLDEVEVEANHMRDMIAGR